MSRSANSIVRTGRPLGACSVTYGVAPQATTQSPPGRRRALPQQIESRPAGRKRTSLASLAVRALASVPNASARGGRGRRAVAGGAVLVHGQQPPAVQHAYVVLAPELLRGVAVADDAKTLGAVPPAELPIDVAGGLVDLVHRVGVAGREHDLPVTQ